VGKPKVNFREAVQRKAEFNYLHKKQSGGSGQFGRVIGYIEPLEDDATGGYEFVNATTGAGRVSC
jgi:elongation factor G